MSRSEADIEFMRNCVTNPVFFANAFFKQRGWFDKGVPAFYREVYAALESGKPKIAVFLPRDHCKTVGVSKVWALHKALTDPQYIRIISATSQLTKALSHDHDEVLRNHSLLRQYFGNQVGENVWTEARRVLKNGAVLHYGSAGSKSTKGASSFKGRPRITLLDDVESTEAAFSEAERAHLLQWYWSDLLPSIPFDTGAQLITLATIAGKHSMAQDIVEGRMGDDWHIIRYPAVDFENGTVLWPERYDVDHFRRLHAEYASANRTHIFSAEYLLNPVDPATQPFQAEMIRTCTEHEAVSVSNRAYFAAIDMAYSKKKKGADYTGVVKGFTDVHNELTVDERARAQMSPQEVLDYIFDLHKRYMHLGGITIGVEAHRLWHDHTFPQECIRRGLKPRVVELKHHGVAKQDRILGLQTGLQRTRFVNTGEVAELTRRLLAWTKRSTDDDDIDALAYLRTLAKSARSAKKADPLDAEGISPVAKELRAAKLGLKQKKSKFKMAQRTTLD